MGRTLRHLPDPGAVVEITCRTVQRRFLLKPCETLNDRILGVSGRAMTMHPVDLHLFVAMSNHMHLILYARDSETISGVMRYVNGNIAREAALPKRMRRPCCDKAGCHTASRSAPQNE